MIADNETTGLKVSNVKLEYKTSESRVLALDGVNLEVARGDRIGIAGESGCGKSSLAWTILNALPENAEVVEGNVVMDGYDLYGMNQSELNRKVRWKKIAVIPQAAMNIFDPIFTVKDQIIETIRVHSPEISKEGAAQRTEDLLKTVGIEAQRASSYPHQLSGGMKQRAAIALALALSPKLLIADEPTTALDVIVQAQIMSLLMDIAEKFDMSLILISHDLALVAQYCQRVAIMYAGKFVETAQSTDLFTRPLHPYTLGLLQSVPNLKADRTALKSIPGSPPSLSVPRKGCSFAPRCPYSVDRCREEEPILLEVEKNHFAACFEWKRLAER